MEGDEEVVPDTMEGREVDVDFPRNVFLRMALSLLGDVDTRVVLRQREAVTGIVSLLSQLIQESWFWQNWENHRMDMVQQERRWKLFMFVPKMLLHKPSGGGLISKEKLVGRFQMFATRKWIPLVSTCDEQAARAGHRKCHRDGDDVERRIVESSRGIVPRKASVEATVALGDQATLYMLQDERRRPQQPREPLPPDMIRLELEIEFQLIVVPPDRPRFSDVHK